MEDEILDLVGEDDRVVGTISRTEVYLRGLNNFRVINAFVRNSEGLLWIPRRSLTKRIFPGGLDVGVGGHVRSGESYDAAFFRETTEEIGLTAGSYCYRTLGKCNPNRDNLSAFMTVYEIEMNETPVFSPTEFSESFWLSPLELKLKLVEERTPPKGDLAILLSLFYP